MTKEELRKEFMDWLCDEPMTEDNQIFDWLSSKLEDVKKEWSLEEKNNFEARYIQANAKQAIKIQELEAKLKATEEFINAVTPLMKSLEHYKSLTK